MWLAGAGCEPPAQAAPANEQGHETVFQGRWLAETDGGAERQDARRWGLPANGGVPGVRQGEADFLQFLCCLPFLGQDGFAY